MNNWAANFGFLEISNGHFGKLPKILAKLVIILNWCVELRDQCGSEGYSRWSINSIYTVLLLIVMFLFLKSIASCLYSWVWHKVYFPHTFYSQNNSKTLFEPGWAQTFFESKRASQNLDLRHETGTSESSNSIKAKTFLFLKNRNAGKNRTFYGFPQFGKFLKIIL